MRIRVLTGAEGEIVFPPHEAEALGMAGGGEGELVTARGAFALVTAARPDAPAAWFAGSLAALTVAEVVQFIFTSLKTGVLLLAFDQGREAAGPPSPDRLRRRSLYFRDGQLVFASSSDPADRLGPVLLRGGLASGEDLERCGQLVGAGRPLGQVLVDEGLLSAGQLYEGVSLQVKEILLNAFVEVDGTFAFLEGAADERNAVKLPERTRDLLLEGMRRSEEAEGLAYGLGGRATLLRPAGAPARALTAAEAAVLEAADGARTIPELAFEAGLGQLAALRAAAALVRDGALAPAAPPVAAAEEPGGPATVRVTGPFETYRRVFARVQEAIGAVQPDPHLRLNSYFDRLPARNRAVFEGVRFAAEADLPVGRVLENVTRGGEYQGAAARARSLEALEDLLAFALFEVKNCLPRAEADHVLREVGHMQMGRA
jgi:hypothetical protein